MIYQFHTVNSKVFELNGIKYRRRFRLNQKSLLSAIVTDVHTGHILGSYILGDVYVNGSPARNWAELESIIYNHECVCIGDDSGSLRGRIFDDTFGVSFE